MLVYDFAACQAARPSMKGGASWHEWHCAIGFVTILLLDSSIGSCVALVRSSFRIIRSPEPLILAGIFYNSWIYGLACLVGTMISTATALLFNADKGLIKNGLFGFNGALVAIALVAYTSPNFTTGNMPNLISGCILCFALSSRR